MHEMKLNRQAAVHQSVALAPSKPELVQQLQQLSTDTRQEAALFARMREARKGDPNVWRPRQLSPDIRLDEVYPSKAELIREKAFGKPNVCHSYTVTPAFPQVVLPLFKSGFLGQIDTFRVCKAVKGALTVLNKWRRYHRMDFRPLQLMPFEWEAQAMVNEQKQILREACLFYYDFDVAAVQRYCGGRFTGDHRRVEQILKTLRYVVSDDTFRQLAPGYVDGIPNLLSADVPYAEFHQYAKRGNQKNVAQHPDLVVKAVVKEDARDLSLVVDSQLAPFVPHLGLIALGIATPKHKKPRIYRHGSLALDEKTQPINIIVDIVLSEPEIRYATVLKEHLAYLWRLAGTFPGEPIDGYDDDISGAFPQRIFHPDTARANASIYGQWLIIAIAMHFGGNFCPSSWEPLSWARCEIAKFLYDNAMYHVALNLEVLELIPIREDTPAQHVPKFRPKLDRLNPPILNRQGEPDVEFRMFVDDLLSACIRRKALIQRMIASSVEAAYLLLGYPGPIKDPILPPVMAWDKMEDRPVAPQRVALGALIDTSTLTVSLEDYKVERLVAILNDTWNRQRKMFTVIDAAVLVGNVIAASFFCGWLRWSMHHLMEALKEQLKKNGKRLARTRHFEELLQEPDEAWLDPSSRSFARIRCLNSAFARAVWRDKARTAITRAMYEEIDFLRTQATEHLSGHHRWRRPISHLIPREWDAQLRQDASTTWGAGGFSSALSFWWQTAWEVFSPEVRRRIMILSRGDPDKISINVLELVAVVINFFGACVAYAMTDNKLDWQPKILLEGDNTSANSWFKKFTNLNPGARALTKLLSFAMKHTDVGPEVGHVPGIDNHLADAVSRGDPAITIPEKMGFLTVAGCRSSLQVPMESTSVRLRRFQPAPELLSALESAILQKSSPWLLPPNASSWGRMLPDDSITFTLRKDSWSCQTRNSEV
jgi:hypothetical protein